MIAWNVIYLFWLQDIATAIRRTFSLFLLSFETDPCVIKRTVGRGSIDPKTNLHLAAALRKAKDQGVPKENIEKAIAKVNRVSISSSSLASFPCTSGRQSKGKRGIIC